MWHFNSWISLKMHGDLTPESLTIGNFICSVHTATVHGGMWRREATELHPELICNGKGENGGNRV